jgi:hypothetical protein
MAILMAGATSQAQIPSETAAAKAPPPALSQNVSEKEMARVSQNYFSLRAKKIESLSCDGVTEVKSLTSAKAPFTFKIAKDENQETSYCDIHFTPSEDPDVQQLEKFTKLLGDLCRTYKSFYFDSLTLMMLAHPLKAKKFTYQDTQQSSQLILDKNSASIELKHNGTDDVEVDYKKVRGWNVANRIVFNPDMQGSASKAITDIKYHVVDDLPTPKIFDSFVEDQRGHSFNSTYTLSHCKVESGK